MLTAQCRRGRGRHALFGRRPRRPLVLGLVPDAGRVRVPEVRQRVGGDRADHRGGLQHVDDVPDEVGEDAEGDHREDDGDGDREIRDPVRAEGPEPDQHREAVDEDAEEGGQRQLAGQIAAEAAQDAGAQLVGRQREGDDRHRDRDPGDRDGGRGDRLEHAAGGVLGREDEERHADVEPLVDLRHAEADDQADAHRQRRREAEGRAQEVDQRRRPLARHVHWRFLSRRRSAVSISAPLPVAATGDSAATQAVGSPASAPSLGAALA